MSGQEAQSAENADVRADAEAIQDGLNTLWGNGDIRFTAESRAALRDADAALARLLGSLTDARRERERVVGELPFGDTCGECGGAALGNPVGPCVRCGYTGTEPDLAVAVAGQFAYFSRRKDEAEAALADAQRERDEARKWAKLPWPSLVRNPEGRFSRALFALRNLW